MAGKINYSLRPAKHVERKMLAESFRKLSAFSSLLSYRYVGFGSYFFSDFQLFHKSLGISNMISIERDTSGKARYEFNRPFNCITIKFGESTSVLPNLTWDINTILWLDYTDKLNGNSLADTQHFFANATAGSVFVITLNVESGKWVEDQSGLQQLKDSLGEDKVPFGLKEKDLRKSYPAVCRKIINNQIQATLKARNGVRPAQNKYIFRQLFNFLYSDGALMLTTGGILFEQGQKARVDSCGFAELDFVRTEMELVRTEDDTIKDDAYKIEIPELTYRELRYLDTHLPPTDKLSLNSLPIPKGDVEKYSKIYRYFPTFAEADV